MRGDALVDNVHFVAVGKANVNIGEFEPETRVNIRGDFVVGLDYILDVGVAEIVEGIDMLLDETLDL